jgi:hypothetical protein
MKKAVCVLGLCLLSVSFYISEGMASINPKATQVKVDQLNKSQLVSLNLELKSKNNRVKSNLTMPFYQTAELERKVGQKNVLIELNPKKGKNINEISVELKLFNQSGAKAFYKKEFIARLNEDSQITVKGLSLKVRPVIN